MIEVSRKLAARALAGSLILVGLAAFLLHAPCRNSGYTDSRFTSFCYSDLAPLLSAPPLGNGEWPFGASEAVSEAPLPTLLVWLVAKLPVGFDFQIVFLQLLLVLALAVIAWVVFELRDWRALDASALVLVPAWPFVMFVGMDLMSVAFVALSFFAWQRDRKLWAGLLAGLAIASGVWAWVLLLVFLVQALRDEKLRELFPTLGVAAAVAMLGNAPKLAAGESLMSLEDLKAGEGSVLFVYSLVEGSDTPTAAWLVLAGAVVAVAAAIWASRLLFDFRPEALLMLLVVIQLLTGPSVSPQQLTHLLWLLPLVWPSRLFVLGVAGPLIAYVMAVWLRFEAASENGKGIHLAWYAVISLLMWGTLAVVGQRALRLMTEQGIDVVEQSRARQ